MQLSDKPAQLTIPFANSGTRTAIPTASQIGITAGAASLTDGFPPLTRTPIASGGVPPSGADMNGILYKMSAADRWANVGGGYPYDSAYATAIGGYPKGARLVRTDGAGYWLNTTDNNTTDPEAGGAGWRPDLMPGATPVTMTGSNVTLTALQSGQPVIRVTGLLTADLNLIFPAITGKWTVINATTGSYTITAKTATGAGVTITGAAEIVGDGTDILAVSAAGITPPKFDNDTSLATTEFVNRIGVNYPRGGGIGLAVATTVSANDAGRWAEVTANVIVTLPTMVSVPVGGSFGFRAVSDFTLKGNGAEVIAPPGATSGANTYAAHKGETLVVTHNGGLWYITSAGFGSDTFASSHGTNGYLMLPGGFIKQWGYIVESTSSTDYKAFPIPFPNNCYNVVLSPEVATPGGMAANFGTVAQIVDKTKFLCTVGGNYGGGGYVYFEAFGD